jgi:hypothetical protein
MLRKPMIHVRVITASCENQGKAHKLFCGVIKLRFLYRDYVTSEVGKILRVLKEVVVTD